MQALKLLDLVDEDGNPSQEFTDLSKAKSDEYPSRLQAIIRAAYADVFSFVDPTKNSLKEIEDAFRTYNPRSQRARMVSLFLALCREAGIQTPVPPKDPNTHQGASPSTPRVVRKPRTNTTQRPRRVVIYGDTPGAVRGGGIRGFGAGKSAAMLAYGPQGAPPSAIMGLLTQLPEPGSGWTQRQRDNFLNALGAVLDLLYPVAGTYMSDMLADERAAVSDHDADNGNS